MRTRLVFISDCLFVLIISFLLFLIAFDFWFPRPFSLVFAVCTGFLAFTTFLYFSKRKIQKESENNALTSAYTDMINELNICSEQERLGLYAKALRLKGYLVEKKKDFLYLPEKNAYVFIVMGFYKLLKKDVVKIFNKIGKTNKGVIIADDYEQETKDFASRFNGKILIFHTKETYSLLKDTDCLPKNEHFSLFTPSKQKGNFKNLLKKKNSASFFWFGLIFLFTSYFVPIKIYYLLVSVLFLIFSLILRLFGKTSDSNIN